MLDVDPRSLRRYLVRQRLLPLHEQVAITPLSGGVSNLVFLIETAHHRWVLKKALPKLRVAADWYSNLEKIFREAECLEVLAPLLPGRVPEIVFLDRDHYILVMTAAPADARMWKSELLAGRVDLTFAAEVGRTLATIHNRTAGQLEVLDRFRDDDVFEQLRIDPFYRTVASVHPDLRPAIECELWRMLRTRRVLVHGDYSPKNILVHSQGMTLLDFEAGHCGDPSFDPAFCLTHLLLKAIAMPHWQTRFYDAAHALWRSYLAEQQVQEPAVLARDVFHQLGILLLARVDGKSPVEYLEAAGQERARTLGRALLLGDERTLDGVVARCASVVLSA